MRLGMCLGLPNLPMHPLPVQLCYVSPYFGKDRGVLVQLGQEQLGHFPLGMWDESQSKPAPDLG